MKRNDIMLVVLIASVSMLIAFFSAQAVFGNIGKQSANVQTVDAISSSVEDPDPDIFNDNAINPTWSVSVGNETDTGSADPSDTPAVTP